MSRLIIRYHKFILVALAALTACSIFLIPSLQVEVDFSSFFPKSDPELTFYQKHTEQLGGTEWSMYIAIEERSGVFDSVFLHKALQFRSACDTLRNIKGIQSLFDLKHMRRSPLGYVSWPYLRPQTSTSLQDSLLIYRDWPITQFFISKKATFLIFQFTLKEGITLDETNKLVEGIDHNALVCGIASPKLFGQKYLEAEYKKLVNSEIKRSIALSLLFIIVVLIFLFRRFSSLLVPLLTVLTSLVIFYGYLALFNRPLTVMANLFPTIILIVGIADVIHVCLAYVSSLQRGGTREESVAITIKEIGLTNFLTSLSTALGFLTLLTSSMGALQSFAIDAAVGVMIAFATTSLLAPALFCLLGFERAYLSSKSVLRINWTDRIFQIVNQRRATIVWLTILCIGLGLSGIFFFNLNNYMLATIPKDSRISGDYSFFDREAGGTRVLEWAVNAQPGYRLNDNELLKEAKKFHDHLEGNDSISKLLTPISAYGWANRTHYVSNSWDLPNDPERLAVLDPLVMKANDKLVFRLMDSTRTYARFIAISPDPGRLVVKDFLTRTQHWIANNLDPQLLSIKPTGMNFLIDRGHEHRIDNLFSGIGLAILAVSLLVGLYFRKIRYVMIMLLANLVPLTMALGFMGVIGLELRGTTSIVFAIGFVIVSDDTLHFLNRYKLESARMHSVKDAVRQSIFHAGKANVVTALILIGGFSILMTSGLGDVYAQGIMISFMLLAGCLVNLFLLPVLILQFIKDDK